MLQAHHSHLLIQIDKRYLEDYSFVAAVCPASADLLAFQLKHISLSGIGIYQLEI